MFWRQGGVGEIRLSGLMLRVAALPQHPGFGSHDVRLASSFRPFIIIIIISAVFRTSDASRLFSLR
jgi:hypothetical protein